MKILDSMSTEIRIAAGNGQRTGKAEKTFHRQRSPGRPNASPSGAPAQVQKVWCAPMSDAGEWVVTWMRVPGAMTYEVQTSLDASQWNSGSKFSGTRAVLLIGPAPRCWVRVRAISPAGPGAWSQSVMGEKKESFQTAA